MDIVLDDSAAPSSVRTPATAVTAASTVATAAIPQLGLPMHPPPPPPPSSSHHFPHCTVYDAGLRRNNPPLLPAENYYARGRHGLTSYDGPDGAPAPVTARRVDKSGLLEIAETDPATYPRACVLTAGAKDVGARGASLRVDRASLLEAVPEDVDQPEEHGGNGCAKTLDEAAAAPPAETLKVEADVHSRSSFKFEDSCLPEQPSSLEGDIKMLTGSPRAHFDVSNAAERLWKRRTELAHLPSSPGSTLRRLRNDPSRASPLISRCADADAARLRNQMSPEFPVNSSPGPIARSQMRCSKDSLDPTSIDSDNSVVDAIKAHRDSLLAMGNVERKNENPSGEKRVEAEGCEHTAVEGVKEKKVSFKGSNKLPDNDNVQTPRVIILSERL